MFKNLKDKKIPLILLNARITKKTFNRWLKINFFSKLIFGMISVAYPQNLETKYFLKKIKTKKINPIGNLKFAENPEENFEIKNKKLKSELNKNKIWVASSTHKNEEIFCANAHKKLKNKYKNLITIIIPRHVHRAKEIALEMKKINLNVAYHSSKIKTLKNIDIYIVDTFGETKLFHEISSTVFLGGSIIKRGGQNPLEAARLGSKILHGPNTDNFTDVYKHLKLLNISKKINTPSQLASSIVFKKNKNSGKKIKKIGQKILNKTINELDNLINNEYKKT
jgi:3-deoxy-D-manno-octulosonic-acid transferase